MYQQRLLTRLPLHNRLLPPPLFTAEAPIEAPGNAIVAVTSVADSANDAHRTTTAVSMRKVYPGSSIADLCLEKVIVVSWWLSRKDKRPEGKPYGIADSVRV